MKMWFSRLSRTNVQPESTLSILLVSNSTGPDGMPGLVEILVCHWSSVAYYAWGSCRASNCSRTCDTCIACLVKLATALSLYPQLPSCELGGCRGYPTVSSGVSPNQTQPVINALSLTLCHIIYAKVSHVSFLWCGII